MSSSESAWQTTWKKCIFPLVFISFFLLLFSIYAPPSVFKQSVVVSPFPELRGLVTLLTLQNSTTSPSTTLQYPHNKRKVQIVLVSGWRSGSSFTYELIASHPAVFALFEPLAGYSWLYLKKLRDWSSTAGSNDYIRNLLLCNFNEKQVEFNVKNRDFILERCDVLKKCQSSIPSVKQSCDGQYLTSLCGSFPVTLLKFVRLPLSLTAELLADPALDNVHVVYLPRDPRAVMASRWDTKKTGWCNYVECNSSKVFCEDMNDDFVSVERLQKLHPGRIHLFRYEDIVLDPANKARELFRDLGIEYHQKVDEFIQSHTTKQSLKKEDTYRVSRERVMAWTREMKWSRVETVQGHCQNVMEKLGYRLIHTAFNITLRDVLIVDY